MVTIYTTVSGFRYLGNITHFNTNNEQPEIFVACLDSYDNGKVYGLWINARQEIEEIKRQISSMLSGSHYLDPDAEPGARMYAIHSHKGFYDLQLDVHADIEDIRAQALFIARHGELGAKLIVHYEGTLEAAEEVINERYQGEYESQLEYATQLFDKLYVNTIPEHLRFCIDYEAFKRTIFWHYFFSIELEGKTHVFFEYLGDWDFKQCLDDFLKPLVDNQSSLAISPTLEKRFSIFALELEAKVAAWSEQNEASYYAGYHNRIAALEKCVNGFHTFFNHLVDTWIQSTEILQSETAGFDLLKAIQQLRNRMIEKHGCDLDKAIRVARVEYGYGGDEEAEYEHGG